MRLIEGVIEIPNGCYYKYEVDKNDGCLVLDRPLEVPSAGNYGFIPGTLAEDGDPLDVFVLGHSPIQPLVRFKAEIIGVLKCVDNGEQDDKLICCFPGYDSGGRYTVDGKTESERQIDNIINYLSNYKPGFIYYSYQDAAVAETVLEAAIGRYNENKNQGT